MVDKIFERTFYFVTIVFGLFAVISLPAFFSMWKFVLVAYVVFLLTYTIFHRWVEWYASKIQYLPEHKFRLELGSFILAGSYLVFGASGILLESIANITNNFGNSIVCHGHYCALLAVLLMTLPFSFLIMAEIVMITDILMKKMTGEKRKGYFAEKYYYWRTTAYLLLAMILAVSLMSWLGLLLN
ncbi:hypothetical protein J4457_04390 [Candidatus Woesearchaeota archaeon]|nr:hypothetical protein [Candidatus Woesearchaeota archaeon]